MLAKGFEAIKGARVSFAEDLVAEKTGTVYQMLSFEKKKHLVTHALH